MTTRAGAVYILLLLLLTISGKKCAYFLELFLDSSNQKSHQLMLEKKSRPPPPRRRSEEDDASETLLESSSFRRRAKTRSKRRRPLHSFFSSSSSEEDLSSSSLLLYLIELKCSHMMRDIQKECVCVTHRTTKGFRVPWKQRRFREKKTTTTKNVWKKRTKATAPKGESNDKRGFALKPLRKKTSNSLSPFVSLSRHKNTPNSLVFIITFVFWGNKK